MDINEARRITSYVDTWSRSFADLAEQLDCSEVEAAYKYRTAKSVTVAKDVQDTLAKLNELAVQLNTSANELVARYA